MEAHVLAWITQYGYIAIFCLLILGIVGLPVPDETLLTFSGYLIYRGQFAAPLTFVAAFAGSACGISISFWLGRTFGLTLVHRYGKYVRLREDHINRAHKFFERAGHWSLTFGYFIPGVRHFTAYAAGIAEVRAPIFALFAYSGAALWVTAFLTLGYLLGDRWHAVEKEIHHYMLAIAGGAAILLVAFLVWRWTRRQGSAR
ncbi:MAG TPA: DedA family protein [Bryobacteraceae bacterium]|nr:DedA family protein [Bryobacteraceae bacterium]